MVYNIFLSFARKHRLWVRGESNEHPKSMLKSIRFFLSENVKFLQVKFSIYLNRRVFVMAKMEEPS